MHSNAALDLYPWGQQFDLAPNSADLRNIAKHLNSPDVGGNGYQTVQSLYALADGGVVGPGLGKAFLVREDGSTVVPALPTDFIFTAVGNELGYIGAVGVLLVFLLVVQRGFSIATRATDGFSKLLAGGLTAVIGLQAFLIVAGVIRLVPLTGVTLPFMSYGGSSVVVNFGLIALLLVISHRTRAPVAQPGEIGPPDEDDLEPLEPEPAARPKAIA